MQELVIQKQSIIAPAQKFSVDFFREFIAYCDASPRTIATYTRAIRQFAKWMAAEGITQPTRADVIHYRDALKEQHKPTTVQAYIMALKQFFNFTEVMGLYPNITIHLKGAKLDKAHKKDNLTTNQAKLLLNSIDRGTLKGLRDYAIISLMLTGGLRTIEVIRADIQDLAKYGSKTILYLQGKGHEEKTDFIIVPIQTEQAILEYLKARGEAEPTDALFISTSNNNLGGRLTTKTISSLVKDRLRAIGLDSDKLTAHSLRHTAITLAIEGGLSLEQAQEFARHTSPLTTQIYIHKNDKTKNKGSQTVAAAIFD